MFYKKRIERLERDVKWQDAMIDKLRRQIAVLSYKQKFFYGDTVVLNSDGFRFHEGKLRGEMKVMGVSVEAHDGTNNEMYAYEIVSVDTGNSIERIGSCHLVKVEEPK
jgi:hypothetical protein